MTDQSRINRPRKSLFERAEESLGKQGFDLGPVPPRLAPARRPGRVVDEVAAPPPPPAPPPMPREVAAPLPPVPELSPLPEPAPAPAGIAPLQLARVKAYQIDRDRLARHGLIQPEAQVTGLLEEFRIVKRRLLAAIRKQKAAGLGAVAQRVLVCSPLPNEGKTYCAANLAIALAAEKDSEVLLVDADFAKPSILSVFGLPRGPGLMDVLANPRVQPEDCILATDISGLYVLPAGNQTNSDSEFLTSSRTPLVLEQLTAGAPNRIVIFDSPPALAASPAAELARHVGQAIIVARADRTGQSALEDALTLLSACPDIKLLLNAAHFSPSGRRFGAYYGQEA